MDRWWPGRPGQPPSQGIGWRRVGERIAYYENHFETENGQSYYTLTFSLTFPHANDVCYLAHCFPYR